MNIKDVFPAAWKKGDNREVAVRKEDSFANMHRQMQNVFDDFFKGFGELAFPSEGASDFSPRIDVSETDKEIQISAELPGMEEKDLDIALAGDSLTIKGEKKTEREEKNKNYHRIERSYGSFQRTIPLPCDVNENRVEALFKNGVLKIKLPKTESALNERRKITVKTG